MDDKNMKSTENYLDNLLNSMNGRQSVSDDTADTPSKTDTSSRMIFCESLKRNWKAMPMMNTYQILKEISKMTLFQKNRQE